MPLVHSSSPAAFKQNVHTLMGEVGHSPHVQSRDQALAIAYATQRKGHADGGPIAGLGDGRAFGGFTTAPWEVRSEARNLMHTGPIYSEVPGRTDAHNMNVPGGSYVIPAENVAHLGQGNTLAGMSLLNKMFGPSGPYGAGRNMPIAHGPGPPRPPRAMSDTGGARGTQAVGHPVPIRDAGGEYVIHPDVVANVALVHTGHRNIHHGHQILDALQMIWHKEHMGELKKYPGPAKA